MKATIALLTALLVSTICVSNARAQYPVQPVAFGGGKAVSGGCADGSCGQVGGCGEQGCGKPGLFGKKAAKGCNNGGCGHKCSLFGWCKKPLPSNAPKCGKPDYPLGFPNSPYVRSPRDYFMMD